MAAKSKNVIEMDIPSVANKIKKVERLAQKVAVKLGFNQDQKDSLAIAVTEAVNNAIFHGNKLDRKKRVQIRFEITEKALVVRVKDEGAGFDLKALRDPLREENLLKDSGRGIFILRTLMDDVSFTFSGSGTEILMVKKRSGS